MIAQTTIMPKEVKLLKLQLNKDGGEKTITPVPLIPGDSIMFEEMALIFKGASKTESTINFTMYNSTNEFQSFSFEFGLKYWPSHCNYTRYQNSGAYDFRPIDNLFSPLPYSELTDSVIYVG